MSPFDHISRKWIIFLVTFPENGSLLQTCKNPIKTEIETQN